MIRRFGGDPDAAVYAAGIPKLESRFGNTGESFRQGLVELANEISPRMNYQMSVETLLDYAVLDAVLDAFFGGSAQVEAEEAGGPLVSVPTVGQRQP